MIFAGAGRNRGRQLGGAGGDETAADADSDTIINERERQYQNSWHRQDWSIEEFHNS